MKSKYYLRPPSKIKSKIFFQKAKKAEISFPEEKQEACEHIFRIHILELYDSIPKIMLLKK